MYLPRVGGSQDDCHLGSPVLIPLLSILTVKAVCDDTSKLHDIMVLKVKSHSDSTIIPFLSCFDQL